MKKNFNLIGNIAHVFIGFVLGYWITNFTDVSTIKENGWFLGLMWGGLFLVFIGGIWELIQNKGFRIKKLIHDALKDVLKGVIGGAIGGVLASYVKDLTVITIYGLIVSIVAIIGYIYVMYKNKGK